MMADCMVSRSCVRSRTRVSSVRYDSRSSSSRTNCRARSTAVSAQEPERRTDEPLAVPPSCAYASVAADDRVGRIEQDAPAG